MEFADGGKQIESKIININLEWKGENYFLRVIYRGRSEKRYL